MQENISAIIDYDKFSEQGIQSLKNPTEWQVNMLSAYFTNYGPFKSDRVKYWRLAVRLVTKRGLSVKQFNIWLKARS
jgi:hypothetical protein